MLAKTTAVPIDAAEEDAPIDASGEFCASAGIVQRRGDSVELKVCHLGDSSTSEQSAEQGFVEHLMRADLVVTRDEEVISTRPIDTWTNGWEWGTSWKLVGELVDGSAPPGGGVRRGVRAGVRSGVLLVVRNSDGPAPGIQAVSAKLGAWVFAHDDWKEIWTMTSNSLDVELSADQTVATVTSCEGSTSLTAAGCGRYTDAEPGPTIELRWDGAAVKAVTRPPVPAEDAGD